MPEGNNDVHQYVGHEPGDQSVTYSKDGTTFQAKVSSNGIFLRFITNSPSFTVYIKGGPAYDTYDYSGTTAHPAYQGFVKVAEACLAWPEV